MGKNRIDIAGRIFGRLRAIKYVGRSRWLCRCGCGREAITTVTKIKSGHARSCGCISTERISRMNRTHRRVSECECGDHVFTDLTRGLVGLLSPEDRHLFDSRSWNAHKAKSGAWSATGTHAAKLHRVVLQVSDPMVVVDHINGDGLDNRRTNIRLCTHALNARNQKPRRGKKSRYKGVTKSASKINPWAAQITASGTHYFLGLHATEEAAAMAYDLAAVRLHGPFAKTNRGLGLLP